MLRCSEHGCLTLIARQLRLLIQLYRLAAAESINVNALLALEDLMHVFSPPPGITVDWALTPPSSMACYAVPTC
jgi:hypothetical protein